MKYRVPQLEPFVDEEELQNLRKVIETAWLTEGPFAEEFLTKILELTGARYGVLTNNGTIGLYLALLAVGIHPGDEVIVPDFTFNASGSSVAFTGAKPVFIDINRADLQMNTSQIEKAITGKTRAIMPVHMYGQACDMDPVLEIAARYGLKVVEDAAQGLGIVYKNRHTGSIGDAGVISFFADKTITTGEGAVVLSNDEETYIRLKKLRNQGRLQSSTFIHPTLGLNFRMTDLQCAVGVAQLKKIPRIVERKLKHYDLYKRLLANVKQVHFVEENGLSNLIPFRVNIWVEHQQDLMRYLEDHSIQTRGWFYPLHRQPCFSYLNYSESDFPETNHAFENGVSLPVFYNLKEEQIEYVCETINNFYYGTAGPANPRH